MACNTTDVLLRMSFCFNVPYCNCQYLNPVSFEDVALTLSSGGSHKSSLEIHLEKLILSNFILSAIGTAPSSSVLYYLFRNVVAFSTIFLTIFVCYYWHCHIKRYLQFLLSQSFTIFILAMQWHYPFFFLRILSQVLSFQS